MLRDTPSGAPAFCGRMFETLTHDHPPPANPGSVPGLRQVPIVPTRVGAEGTKVSRRPCPPPDHPGDRWKEVFWERRDSQAGFLWPRAVRLSIYNVIGYRLRRRRLFGGGGDGVGTDVSAAVGRAPRTIIAGLGDWPSLSWPVYTFGVLAVIVVIIRGRSSGGLSVKRSDDDGQHVVEPRSYRTNNSHDIHRSYRQLCHRR